MQIFKILLIFLTLASCFLGPEQSGQTSTHKPLSAEGFADWKIKYKKYALRKGIERNILEQALAKTHFNPKYAKFDRKQNNKPIKFTSYYQTHINNALTRKAKSIKTNNKDLLKQISEQFSVNPNYLISLWAIETKFGQYSGSDNIIEALANLAYEGRREKLFTQELSKALLMIQKENITYEELKGSYAGAVGQIQFLPSSYFKYAYDFDGDNKKDIWHNTQDILASTANYLATLGWQKDLPSSYEVKFKESQKISKIINNPRKKIKLSSLKKYGITRANGETLKHLDEKVKIISYDNRYFVLFNNYEILKDWNRSDYFSLTVGMLAEQL